jgi:hypothetical protein
LERDLTWFSYLERDLTWFSGWARSGREEVREGDTGDRYI